MSNLRKKIDKNRRLYDKDVNPMDYIANLVDAMLVLAVGIMLALVINWNVDISPQDTDEGNNNVSFSQEYITDTDDGVFDPDKLEKTGDLYYDKETGTYYIIDKGDNN